jgi:hypothetical protein
MRAVTGVLAAAGLAAGLATALPAAAQPTTRFEVRILGTTTDTTLALPDGTATAAPISEGVYAVAKGDPIFVAGSPAGSGLEHLAEDGQPGSLVAELGSKHRIKAKGGFKPGTAFTIRAAPGEKLFFATMFEQSNDLFLAPAGEGIALFDETGKPLAGDRTAEVALWDAGTEVNQAPGTGADQAPREAGPNTGAAEDGVVRRVDDGFRYPPVAAFMRLDITPLPADGT